MNSVIIHILDFLQNCQVFFNNNAYNSMIYIYSQKLFKIPSKFEFHQWKPPIAVVCRHNLDRRNVIRQNVEQTKWRQTKCRTDKMSTNLKKIPSPWMLFGEGRSPPPNKNYMQMIFFFNIFSIFEKKILDFFFQNRSKLHEICGMCCSEWEINFPS